MSEKKPRKRRSLPREARREQLIHATINSIAENGLSGTTMATVTRGAGLSMGIANLHFESKEKMLQETLRYVTDEYTNGHRAILLDDKYGTIAEKMRALLDFQFSAKIVQKNKLAVWVAFWGEAKFRPTCQRIRSQAGLQVENSFRDLFQQAIDEGGCDIVDADLLARGFTALVNGLWLDILVAPRQFTRPMARRIAAHYLASAFPQHLPVD